jgi:hypothetical protein
MLLLVDEDLRVGVVCNGDGAAVDVLQPLIAIVLFSVLVVFDTDE